MIEYSLFLIASYIAAVAATIAGFGSSTLLVPVALFFMDLKTAVFLVACFHLFNNTFKIRLFWNKIDFKTCVIFGIPSIICAFIGATLISHIPVEAAKTALAVFLILFTCYSFLKPQFKLSGTVPNAFIGGGLSGFLAGLIGMGGAVRAMFLVAFNLPKEVYIATSAMIAFVIDLTRIPTYLYTNVVQDTSYYVLLPFLLITAYVGVKTGKRILGRINQALFRKIVLICLMLVGIKLLFV